MSARVFSSFGHAAIWMRFSERFLEHRHAAPFADLVLSFLPRFPELEATDFELDLLPS